MFSNLSRAYAIARREAYRRKPIAALSSCSRAYAIARREAYRRKPIAVFKKESEIWGKNAILNQVFF